MTTFEPLTPNPGHSLLLAYRLQAPDAHVLIIGGGGVAADRLRSCLSSNARKITLVCPRDGLCAEVEYRLFTEKWAERSVTYIDRGFIESDIESGRPTMVLTAIDDHILSENIAKICRAIRLPVNVADVPPRDDFYFGSMLTRGPLQVFVSTGGKGPRLANIIRRMISDAVPDYVGPAIDNVGVMREELRARASGKEVVAIKRRMGWMIDVCDKWTLEELARMDDDMCAQVLDGWESGQVKGYGEVSGARLGKAKDALRKGCPIYWPGKDKADVAVACGAMGFVAGIALGAGVVAAYLSRRR